MQQNRLKLDPESKRTLTYRLNKDKKFEKPIKSSLPGKFTIKNLNSLEIKLE